jgi:ribosomal protein S18 acetylase RimI-like enzyme
LSLPAVEPEIIEVTAVTTELVQAMGRLLPQLSATAPPLGARELGEIVDSPATTLLVARHGPGRHIVGTATLAVFRIPTGLRARLESLVVDRSARGRGVAEALCRAVLARAQARGAITLDLTSSPTRSVANRLYQRLGFAHRDSNAYRLLIG